MQSALLLRLWPGTTQNGISSKEKIGILTQQRSGHSRTSRKQLPVSHNTVVHQTNVLNKTKTQSYSKEVCAAKSERSRT